MKRRELLSSGPGGWVAYWREGPATLVRFEDRDGRLEAVELQLLAGVEPLTADRLRDVPIGRIVAWCNSPDAAAEIRTHMDDPVDLPLRPEGFGKRRGRGIAHRLGPIPEPPYGDNFYRRVAAAYSSLARQVSRPAAELAEANDVPVTTVHTWVKEARRRGFLPPGRKGKAG